MERSQLSRLVFAGALAGGALLAALRRRAGRGAPSEGSPGGAGGTVPPARNSVTVTVRRGGEGAAGQADARHGAWRRTLPRRIRTGPPAPADPSPSEPRRVWVVEAGPEWDGAPEESVIRRPEDPEV
ncbi:hypothetical protein BN1051_01853 [Arthrobacter saudimassiliensis]|uniref:Uncharacterized protein n=1 Tax=Arthrobacter saudimassiliensis TaxID=1461584 RepID=A0A078MUK6_9MICC|nr:hypothetical protein BN1051_01853 [Arthrobacter saudimassiliensis]